MTRYILLFASVLILVYLQLKLAHTFAASQLPDKIRPNVLRNIPYPGASAGERRRSLDLYLPGDLARKPPLVIFVHGGFWLLSDDDYRIGPQLAETLVRDGIAVALVRYRLAPTASNQDQADDVAAAVALLLREARRYGYDESRIFLSGHSAGGHLTALVALDPSYLSKHKVSPKALAGVIPSAAFTTSRSAAASQTSKGPRLRESSARTPKSSSEDRRSLMFGPTRRHSSF